MGWGTAAAAVAGGAASYLGAANANKDNWKIAKRQMEFQREMSNTAVQRRMEDMRLAGINPLLAGKWEASSPAGASATMQNAMGQGVTSALQSAGMAAQLKKTRAEVAGIKANTLLTGRKTGAMEVPAWIGERLKAILDKFMGDSNSPSGTGGQISDYLTGIDPKKFQPTPRTKGSGTAKSNAWTPTLHSPLHRSPKTFDQPTQNTVLREIATISKRIQTLQHKSDQGSTAQRAANKKEIASWKYRRDQLRKKARNQ